MPSLTPFRLSTYLLGVVTGIALVFAWHAILAIRNFHVTDGRDATVLAAVTTYASTAYHHYDGAAYEFTAGSNAIHMVRMTPAAP